MDRPRDVVAGSCLDRAFKDYNSGNLINAKKQCMALMKKKVVQPEVYLLMAHIFYKKNDLEESEYYSILAINENPFLPEAYNNLGDIYMSRRDIEGARRYYHYAISVKPELAESHFKLSECLLSMGQINGAIEAYCKILYINPDLYVIQNKLGNALKLIGKLDDAKECFYKVIAIKPDYAPAWNNLGCVYSGENKHVIAVRYFLQAINLDPDMLIAYMNCGSIFRQLNMLSNAIEVYTSAIVKWPCDDLIRKSLAETYFYQGSFELAVDECKKTVALKDNVPDIYYILGKCLSMANNFSEAEKYYNKTIFYNPLHGDALHELGNINLILKRLDEAKIFYKKALNVCPTMFEVYNNLGYISKAERKYIEAIAYFKEAIRLNVNYVDALLNLGNTYLEVQVYSEALVCFQCSIEINPTCKVTTYNMATVQKFLGNINEAIRLYKVALTLDPQYEDAFYHLVHSFLVTCDWENYGELAEKIKCMTNNQLACNKLPSVPPHHTMLFPFTFEMHKAIAKVNGDFCIENNRIFNKRPYKFAFKKGGRLKIGYVSSDFGNHPTSHLMQSIPGFHNKTKYEIFCYALSGDDGTGFRKKISQESEHFVDLSEVLNDGDAADIINSDGIHILINLNVYTKGGRNEIFALRPAPIQAIWLGYPGTSGASFIDYLITDAITCPLEHSDRYSEKLAHMPGTFFIGDHKQMFPHMQEKKSVIHKTGTTNTLPDNAKIVNGNLKNVNIRNSRFIVVDKCLKVGVEIEEIPTNDLCYSEDNIEPMDVEPNSLRDQQEPAIDVVPRLPENRVIIYRGVIPPDKATSLTATGEKSVQSIMLTARDHYGIPNTAVVYCNFNQLYKFDPITLMLWISVLENVPNSVLWLLRFPSAGENNLRTTFVKSGLEPTRLIFSNVAPKEEHVRRGQLADVALDTIICNGHTTNMDLLWAGTPVVTLLGETIPSRIAASQLHTLGCSELVAVTRKQYVDIAVRLGTDKRFLKRMRDKVWISRISSRLFDCRRFTADLENLYSKMWAIHSKGDSPKHIETVLR